MAKRDNAGVLGSEISLQSSEEIMFESSMCIVSLEWRYGDRTMSNRNNTEQYLYLPGLGLGDTSSIENYNPNLGPFSVSCSE